MSYFDASSWKFAQYRALITSILSQLGGIFFFLNNFLAKNLMNNAFSSASYSIFLKISSILLRLHSMAPYFTPVATFVIIQAIMLATKKRFITGVYIHNFIGAMVVILSYFL